LNKASSEGLLHNIEEAFIGLLSNLLLALVGLRRFRGKHFLVGVPERIKKSLRKMLQHFHG
jgi:hypothetical protein